MTVADASTTMILLEEGYESFRTTAAITSHVLHEGVGGFAEPVLLNDAVTMWVNEEGAFIRLENQVATSVAAALVGRTVAPFFGPVVFTGGYDPGTGWVLPLGALSLRVAHHIDELSASLHRGPLPAHL